eukprot:COSAG06_NODE_10210_length_1726_cov_2.058390_2_plen_139_part_00
MFAGAKHALMVKGRCRCRCQCRGAAPGAESGAAADARVSVETAWSNSHAQSTVRHLRRPVYLRVWLALHRDERSYILQHLRSWTGVGEVVRDVLRAVVDKVVHDDRYTSCLESPSQRVTKAQIKPSHALSIPLKKVVK